MNKSCHKERTRKNTYAMEWGKNKRILMQKEQVREEIKRRNNKKRGCPLILSLDWIKEKL